MPSPNLDLRLARVASLLAVVAMTLGATGCGEEGNESAGQRPTRTAIAPQGAQAPKRAQAPEGAQGAGLAADRAAVRKAVIGLLRTNDVRVICERSLTPRLFRLIFAGPAACLKAASEDEDDEPPKRVEVTKVEIAGTRATAHTRLIGGDTAGAEGLLSLRKVGKQWRTDDFSAAFLHSSVTTSLQGERDIPAEVSRCIGGRLHAMPDRRFKHLALALIGEKREGNVRLLELLSDCERQGGRITSVRRELEKEVTQTLRRARVGRETIACSLRRLRTTLPDSVLIALAATKGARSRARITREVVAATVACGPRGSPAPRDLSPA